MAPISVSFERFMLPANTFYKSIGLQAYVKADGKRPSFFLNFVFLVNVVNLNLVLLSELTYVLLSFKNNTNILESIMNLCYIGFVSVGNIKIYSIWSQKQRLTELMQHMLNLYPQDAKLQEDYVLKRYMKKYKLIISGYAAIHLCLIWTYNLFEMVSYFIYDYWLQVREVPRNLPYYCWIPWNWHDNWSYYLLYTSQNLAGHTCMNGQIANDLLLCAVATQLIMHYQNVAKRIEAHVAGDERKDAVFLNEIIEYHKQILATSEIMNEVFGISLLFNFLSSSFTMCFLGFQMTTGVATEILVRLFLFLFCSLIQIYMISNYGEQLIFASNNVGHAVYNHLWYSADLRYRKILILIIERAQKPCILKATTFLKISLGTMTDLIQISYKFFALLRTMYSNN